MVITLVCRPFRTSVSRWFNEFAFTRCADTRRLVPACINIPSPRWPQKLPEVLTELHRSQESAYNLRDSARQNYLNRAKICSKIIKYPNVEDYTVSPARSGLWSNLHNIARHQLALKEHDEKQLYSARQNILDLRNVYAILTDILHKNINKVGSSEVLLICAYLPGRFVHPRGTTLPACISRPCKAGPQYDHLPLSLRGFLFPLNHINHSTSRFVNTLALVHRKHVALVTIITTR